MKRYQTDTPCPWVGQQSYGWILGMLGLLGWGCGSHQAHKAIPQEASAAKEVHPSDQEVNTIAHWNILPSVVSNTDTPQGPGAWMGLMGHTQDCGTYYFFDSHRRLLKTDHGAMVSVHRKSDAKSDVQNQDHADETWITIGSFVPVQDPLTGYQRVDLCNDAYAKVCSFQVLENPSKDITHGCHEVKLRIVVFDEEGFVQDRIDFPRVNE